MQENNAVTAGARVSIVDDDKSMREAIQTLIGAIGLTAEEFCSAEDFLNSGRCQIFNCLILDVKMPGLSGLDLQRKLAAENIQIPIVFITAHYSEEERAKAMEAGAVDFLRKPFTEQELFTAISASLAIAETSGEVSDREPD